MQKAAKLSALAAGLACVFAVGLWAQEGPYYVDRKWAAWGPGGTTVISEDYYAPVFVDPVVRYRYPALQAFGDGWRYKRLGEPHWAFVKVDHQLYILGGPGSYWGNWTPFAFGPGEVVMGARGSGYTTVPVAGALFTVLLDAALRF